MHSKPVTYTVLLLAAVTLLHGIVAAILPLSIDEAHYALYGAFPALSYFDHPPMVGWLQFVALSILGNSELALRLWALLIWIGVCIALYRLARRILPEQAYSGFFSVALINLATLNQLISMSVLPEIPLLLFSLLTAHLVLDLVETPTQNSTRIWLKLGVVLGLAALSKYTAITLVLSIALVLVVERRWSELLNKGPWLGALIALVLISPILIWNAEHQWISFTYQLEHGTGRSEWDFANIAILQVAQFGLYGAALYCVGWVVGTRTLLQKASTLPQRQARALALFSLPILLLFGISAGKGHSLPHWTMVSWVLLSPLTLAALISGWKRPLWRRLQLVSHALSLILITLMFLILAVPQLLPEKLVSSTRQDFEGWSKAAQTAQTLLAALPDAEPSQSGDQAGGSKGRIMITSWTEASRVAWYAYPTPVNVLSERNKQFHIWYGEADALEQGVLIVDDHKALQAPIPTAPAELNCQYHSSQPAYQAEVLVNRFHFYICNRNQSAANSAEQTQ